MHYLLAILGIITWLFGTLFYALTILLAVLAHKLYPTIQTGNCWTYALPRWWNEGGYLLIRPADGQRLFGCIPVPHVIWIKGLPTEGVELEQFIPIARKVSRIFPWYTLYFEGKVITKERPHNTDEHKKGH